MVRQRHFYQFAKRSAQNFVSNIYCNLYLERYVFLIFMRSVPRRGGGGCFITAL